jgi:hypothetical protein
MTKTGYCHLLAIASLDGLVEASQLSRVLGGVGNEVQSMLTRIFSEEYGKGILARKHSTYFTTMLKQFKMDTQPEAYFDLAPWEVLFFFASASEIFYDTSALCSFLRFRFQQHLRTTDLPENDSAWVQMPPTTGNYTSRKICGMADG